MNKLLHDRIPCLDHGYVQLLDVMGDDKAIVDAARMSIAGEKVRAVQEDRGLIRYLMRHRHSTPFEMVEFKFMCKMPIFVARQWIRHRTASVNEMSARYSELPAEFYVPEEKDIQLQATANKQGRADGVMEDADVQQARFKDESEIMFGYYKERLDEGMARELARINLPLSTYTQWVWKQNLHNLMHLLSLRMDSHAQYEIRVYAEAMASVVKQVCPLAWEAFEDFRLKGMSFSAVELKALMASFRNDVLIQWPTKREKEEFEAKLLKMERL